MPPSAKIVHAFPRSFFNVAGAPFVVAAALWIGACSGSSMPETPPGSGPGGAGTGGASPATSTGGASATRPGGSGGSAVAGGTGTGGAGTGGAPTGTGGTPARPPGDAGVDAGSVSPPDAGSGAGADATAFPPAAGRPTIYLAGDSTVSTYTPAQAPQQGWGQRLQEFLTTDVLVVNRAIGGRSSKSFVDEGHLAEILTVIKPGDYLFAQWGINDRSVAGPTRATDPATTFRTYLKQYIDGARAKNAIPVLVTPTPRHQFTNGVFQNGFPEYCAAILAVGAETNTPVVDLQTMGLAYYTMIGDAMVSSVISLDALHFKAEGAFQMARLVAQGIANLNLPISKFVVQSKL